MLSEQFFIPSFIFAILVSTTGLLLCIVMIVSVILHRPCRTVTNLLVCNTTAWIANFQINILLASIYGFSIEWAQNEPFCKLRAIYIVISIFGISSSYAVQAISRLFFAVLYRYRYLVTFRVHWYLIALNWLFSILLPITALFIPSAYVFVEEMRICMINMKIMRSLIYLFASGFLIPFTIVITIYFQILHRAQKSTRQINAMTNPHETSHMPNAKRQVKLAQNIILCVGIYGVAGIPWIVIVLWESINTNTSPPQALYLIAMIGIALSATVMMIFLLYINREVKNFALRCLLRLHQQMPHLLFSQTRQLRTSVIGLP